MSLTKVKGSVWDSEDNDLGVNVKDYGAVGDGIVNDTAAIQAALDSGADTVFVPPGTYLVSRPASLDAGNDRCIQLDSTTATTFIGSGYNTVIKADLANSFDGQFDIIGLDQTDATGGKFTIGNFKIDGDRANAKASQDNVLLRLQTGTTVTATNYEVDVLPIWGIAATGGGCYMGCDRVTFDSMWFNDIGEHGVALKNTSGDGRMMYVTGKSIHANNCDGLAFDYSGGSQVNGGPYTSNIGSIIGKDNAFGCKIAGMHQGKLGLLDLEDTNLVTQNGNAAFYTNSEFKEFTVDVMHIQDSYNGSVSHAQIGSLTINKLYGRNNNTAGNVNGEVVQGNTGSLLTINEYDCIGHANSTYATRILEGKYTYLSIVRAEGFDTTTDYSGLSIETNGVAFVENSKLNHSPATGKWLARLDTNSTGKIFVNGLDTVGGAGHGPRAQGSGDVFVNNADVSGFTGSAMGDTDYALKIGSNVKGYTLVSNTTDLENIGSRVNTDDKFEGKMWFNSTTNKPVYAASGTAAGLWVDATGATAHTPV